MDSGPLDLTLLVFRIAVGVVFIAHGYNHIWGGGKIAGTARWFSSLGMRNGAFQAWTASITELVAGVLLIVGLLVPAAGAAVIGVMLVAWITNHRSNGFFIFRPGEGYEYVMTLTAAGILFAGTGGGYWSLDRLLGILTPPAWQISLLAVAAGTLGALGLLAVFWRPAPKATK